MIYLSTTDLPFFLEYIKESLSNKPSKKKSKKPAISYSNINNYGVFITEHKESVVVNNNVPLKRAAEVDDDRNSNTNWSWNSSLKETKKKKYVNAYLSTSYGERR
jgi:hypothetical protein